MQRDLAELERLVGGESLRGRTGGAVTLAVGMAVIFTDAMRWTRLPIEGVMKYWYHFAIMFEALFILTTLDAGTRVGRYILQDFLGNLWKPLGDTRAVGPNLLASGLMVVGWGTFLIQGVRDPLGGINSLWPLFGIANQMLAAIALCLATTILLKMTLTGASKSSLSLTLITLIPLIWLLSVTFTAGVQKVWHSDPRIGFISGAADAQTKREAIRSGLASLPEGEVAAKAKEAAILTKQVFNLRLDAVVAISFLVLVSIVVMLSIWEWVSLLSRRKPAILRETEPVWLPDYAVAEGGRNAGGAAGAAALTLALAKELSGEAHFARAQQQIAHCECSPDCGANTDQKVYMDVTERRFNGVRRCC